MKINTWFLMLEIKIKRYDDVFNGIMSKIRKLNDDWLEYSKDYMKIRFNSDDHNLPLNKPLKFDQITVTQCTECKYKVNKINTPRFINIELESDSEPYVQADFESNTTTEN